MNFEINKKLELLGETLVPQYIQDNAPQFYQLILAFLRNLQQVQDSINSNFLDTIDVTKIKNDEIIRIYMDTYMSQISLDEDTYPKYLKDLILVSKDLSTKKGTIQLYKIMLRLAVYLIENVKNQYQILEEKYNNETNLESKKILKEELDLLKINNYKNGIFEYYQYDRDNVEYLFDPLSATNEELTPFKYHIKSDITKSIFEKYVKPFCHPIGWVVDFTQVLYTFIEDYLDIYCRFNITIYKKVPTPKVGKGYVAGNINKNYLENFDNKVFLGGLPFYDYYKSIVTDTSRLFVENNIVYYDNKGIATCPPYISIDVDKLIDRKITLPLVAGFNGLQAGLNNLVVGNTNGKFPLQVLSFKYIPVTLYTEENYFTKTDDTIKQPVYDGTINPILKDGTTVGTNYVKTNQYNDIFTLTANSDIVSKTGNRYASAGGGMVAGRQSSFYNIEITDDRKN